MTSSRSKVFSGPEFEGNDELQVNDISDWVVEGFGGEAAKQALDDFEWDGGVVMGITLQTSADNKKVNNANIFLTGELMKSNKEIRANRLFGDADKELRIVYLIEEASALSFRNGTMVGDFIDNEKITWSVVKKNNRGSTDLDLADYESQHIGKLCIRPTLVPLSPAKARLTILVFPLSLSDLETQHPHSKNAAFPGIELFQCDVEMFPAGSSELGKSWGCPLVPLLYLGGNLEDHLCLPPTQDIKAAISSTLRTTTLPTTKRDLRTLAAAWTAIQDAGPSKLKDRAPDTLWPLWTRGNQTQRGE